MADHTAKPGVEKKANLDETYWQFSFWRDAGHATLLIIFFVTISNNVLLACLGQGNVFTVLSSSIIPVLGTVMMVMNRRREMLDNKE